MKAPLLCLTALLMLFVSCRKEHGNTDTNIPPVNNPGNNPNNDSPRLKDMVVNRLPSPYYHFDYDDAGKITGINYQSGARIYAVRYTDNRSREWKI